MSDKRFTRIICSNDEYTGSLYCNDEPLKIDDACNLLNELHEENQKCKEYNGILYANHTKTDRKLVKQISELEKENEQLQHDATILIQSNQDYRKENERLRRCINSIYTIARLEEVD